MLVLKDLSIAYGKKIILKDVKLKLETGNALTILGANGSGKSSLVRAISGLIDFKGSITINTHDTSTLTVVQRAKLCAYIPAKLESFDQQITVREFVLLGRFAHKERWSNYKPSDYEKVDQVLEELNLQKHKDQALATLSSGEQQLLMIAQALTQESPLLIFDEPTAHLDPKNVVRFVKIFQKLKKHYTLLLITHDIHLAQALEQPILFIQDQKATLYQEEFFNPQTLFKHYGVHFDHNNAHLGVSFD